MTKEWHYPYKMTFEPPSYIFWNFPRRLHEYISFEKLYSILELDHTGSDGIWNVICVRFELETDWNWVLVLAPLICSINQYEWMSRQKHQNIQYMQTTWWLLCQITVHHISFVNRPWLIVWLCWFRWKDFGEFKQIRVVTRGAAFDQVLLK